MMMNKQALAEALEELKNIRAENEKEEAARREKAEEACPRLKELLEERFCHFSYEKIQRTNQLVDFLLFAFLGCSFSLCLGLCLCLVVFLP